MTPLFECPLVAESGHLTDSQPASAFRPLLTSKKRGAVLETLRPDCVVNWILWVGVRIVTLTGLDQPVHFRVERSNRLF